ncbi:MAG TPA: glycosyltransferase [Thermosynechococcaceae cyanobacterium]
MRKLYFLVPGMGGRFACGGLWAELKTIALAQQICPAEAVTYRQREKDVLFLPDLLRQRDLGDVIFVISWGFDVPALVKKLKSYPVIYHAHSSGYGFNLPSSIPIVAVSRNTMGYWGQRSPNSLIYYLPNQISEEFRNFQGDRDIDVLIQARKSSEYLLQKLVPALKQHCNVCVIDSYVADLASLFNRAKVYLYDSAEYWAQQKVSEGFGLQPMEAMACGCQVFSSVNGGLSDYLDPGFNCYKIAGYSKEFDLQRVLKAVQSGTSIDVSEQFFEEHRTNHILERLKVILSDINCFFDQDHGSSVIRSLTKTHLLKLFVKKVFSRLKKKYFKSSS